MDYALQKYSQLQQINRSFLCKDIDGFEFKPNISKLTFSYDTSFGDPDIYVSYTTYQDIINNM